MRRVAPLAILCKTDTLGPWRWDKGFGPKKGTPDMAGRRRRRRDRQAAQSALVGTTGAPRADLIQGLYASPEVVAHFLSNESRGLHELLGRPGQSFTA